MAFLVLLFSDFYIARAGNNLYEAVENANEALPNPTPLFEVRTKSDETAVRLKVNLIDARIKEVTVIYLDIKREN